MNIVNEIESPFRQRAMALIGEALASAYRDGGIPEGVEHFLGVTEKAGKVCCVFFNGRSGSFFAQSFFDKYCHPQVLTIHPVALAEYESSGLDERLELYNSSPDRTEWMIEAWCGRLLDDLPHLFDEAAGQSGLNDLCAPRDIFTKFVTALLFLLDNSDLTPEILLKILFVSYRLSRGGPLDCSKPLCFIWQAHTPSAGRKRWIKRVFKDYLLLTVVRFPEKALDSHLVHHAFETVSRPTTTLMRRLLFQHMAIDNELLTVPPDGTEYAVRFEDLHHHPAHVLRALCELLGVPYHEELSQSSFSMRVMGKTVSGARKLTPEEFQCKLLNYYDRLKLRFLLQEEYAAWGYGSHCEPGLDESLAAYRKDRVAQMIPFAAHAVLTQTDDAEDAWFSMDPEIGTQRFPGARPLHVENQRQREIFEAERVRRDRGIHVTPLLYPLEGLPTS